MNTTPSQSPLFTDLNPAETSTVQGGYYGNCQSQRRHYVPVYCYQPSCCSSSSGSGSVVQTVNIVID